MHLEDISNLSVNNKMQQSANAVDNSCDELYLIVSNIS